MTNINTIPLLIEPNILNDTLNNTADTRQSKPPVLIIDLSTQKQYQQAHIPSAVFLNYADIVSIKQPYTGLLPEPDAFCHTINAFGITADTHIIAYDEEGGGKAARLIWTLHAMGHNKASLLNGGLIAWYREKLPLSNKAVIPQANPTNQQYTINFNQQPVVADTDYIKSSLNSPQTGLLDARSLEEYNGTAKYARHAGRIPGAQHFEWNRALNAEANYRLHPKETLQAMLDELGLTKNREIIVYCQSHHRSALSYFMLKHLGYEKVRGYPGSWSEWGNRSDTPIEN